MPAEVRRRGVDHHLLMMRSKLMFDQLVGSIIQYGADQSNVRTDDVGGYWASAFCSDHVMRSGRHFAVFNKLSDHGGGDFGVVRPMRIDGGELASLDNFHPCHSANWEYMMTKRTERWGVSNIHCCLVDIWGHYDWCNWTRHQNEHRLRIAGFQYKAPFGILLDLEGGTLSVYQNGRRIQVLKHGLSGEYSWFTAVRYGASVSIRRGLVPDE